MKIKRRLKNRKGFTLAETLLAILILLLVSTIVATGVPVARRAYQKVVLAANAQDYMATAVSALRDELGTARDVRVDDTLNKTKGSFITYYSADTGMRSRIFLSDGDYPEIMLRENESVEDLKLEFVLGPENENKYTRPLVSGSSKKSGETRLYVSYKKKGEDGEDGIEYDPATRNVTFKGLKVRTEETENLVPEMDLSIHVFFEKTGE